MSPPTPPTGNLDLDAAGVALDLLLELQAATATALVVVSHDRSLDDRFDRVVRIEDAELVS